jgi:hypothetical protein
MHISEIMSNQAIEDLMVRDKQAALQFQTEEVL